YLQCMKLGGAGETKTLVTIGIDPSIRENIENIKISLQEKEATLEKIRISLNRLNDLMKKRALDVTESTTREKLLMAMKKYRALVDSDQRQFETAQLSLSAHPKAYVSVETQIFPNVEISFGRGLIYRSPVRTNIGHQVLYVEDRAIVVQPTLPHFLQIENEES
ncbi:MAG TPA: FapA family protein, partial [Turneriella sp.]|nr:FapA family protein [Turneriella sp.]